MYVVDWLPEVEEELARIWNESQDRASVTSAANGIDRALTLNPLVVGESREGNVRIAFERPLAVICRVFVSEGAVQVSGIWRYER